MAMPAPINVIGAVLLVLLTIVWVTKTHGAFDPDAFATSDILVTATPIKAFRKSYPKQTEFGRLKFVGGLVLDAEVRQFGGWSGLAFDPDGKEFIAISDRGAWMTATLQYADGVPSGIANARFGPLLDENGKAFDRHRDRDSESIAIADGKSHEGQVIVGFEQHARLARYDVTPQGLSKTLGLLALPRAADEMARNNGFEAMTVMRGGAFKGHTIAVSERLYDPWRNHTGWIWASDGIKPFHITNIGDFDITDIASLDDGTLFVLERRFRWLEGVKMRVRRIAPDMLVPGATITGETLFKANMDYEIDNMEGLSATRSADGNSVILTMISDDNFNDKIQRTVLLQFSLPAAETAKTQP